MTTLSEKIIRQIRIIKTSRIECFNVKRGLNINYSNLKQKESKMSKLLKSTIVLGLMIMHFAFTQGTVTGTVKSTNGDPVIGANVVLAGTSLGAAAGSDGNYSIDKVPVGTYTVVVSAIGFQRGEQQVSVTDQEAVKADFQLGLDVLGLSDVVVTGVVNPASKIESSVSISTLSIRDAEKGAPRTTAEVFRSIPGVRSEASGGDGNTNITVRGVPISSGGSKYVQLQEDGLPVLQFGDIAFATQDIFLRADYNVDRIEAIRGGSASTLASNSPAGIINLVSKTGGVEGGSVRTTLGADYNSSQVDFEYGSPLGQNLSFHVGGFFRSGEGPRTAGYTANKGGQLKLNVTKRYDGGFARIYFKSLNDRAIAYMPMPLKVEGTNDSPEWSSIDGFDASFGTMHSPYLLQNIGIGEDSDHHHDDDENHDNELRRTDVADGMHPESNSFGAEIYKEVSGGWTIQNKSRLSLNHGRFLSPFPAQVGDAQSIAESIGGTGAYLQYTDGSDFGSGYQDNGLLMRIHLFDTELHNFDNLINDFNVSKDLGFGEVSVGYYRSNQSIDMSWLWNSYLMEVNGENAKMVDVYAADSTKLSQNGLYAYGVPAWGNCCQRNYDTDYETSAPYLAFEMELNEALNLDASIRADEGHVTGHFAGPAQTEYDVNNDGVISPNEESVSVIDHASSTPVDYTYSYTSYSFGANYKLSENQAVFARLSKGGSAKADRLLFGRSQYTDGSTMYTKDMVSQTEVGYKHLFANGGVFATFFMANTAEEGGYEATTQKTIENDYKASGLELEFAYNLGMVDFRGYTVYTNAEITSGDNKGNTPRRQPAVMYSLVPTFPWGRHSAGLSLIGQTDAYAQDSNELVLPAYLIVNAFANYQLSQDLVFSLNANNLTNAVGVTESEEGSIVENQVNYVRARPIAGRSISVSLGYQF